MYLNNPDNFPVDCLPSIIKNTVLEMQQNTGFPLPLINSSALAVVSIACQNAIDVRLPIGSDSPCSLYMLSEAESGEGKTVVDSKLTQPIRDFEANEARNSERLSIEQEASRISWEMGLKKLKIAIGKNLDACLVNSIDPSEHDQLLQKHEQLEQRLTNHLSNEPRQQPIYKMIYSNTTPAKMALDLYENWPSAGLISDEAGSLFRGQSMKDLGMLNQLWDGGTLNIDRVSSPSFKVRGARLTISLMVQEKILENYFKGRGSEARDIGFAAQCLVASPLSMKGTRFSYNQTQSWGHLEIFQKRVTEILTQDKLEVDQGRKDRRILEYSQEAKNHWFNFRNNIEADLNVGRYLSDITDCASKITTNIARMAALFHFFEGLEGDISVETERRAEAIGEWYLHEFKRRFAKKPEVPLEVSDAHELEQWFVSWFQKHQSEWAIQKSKIAQYGPNKLRKNASRRENALNVLICQNKIYMQMHETVHWIMFNPNFFPILGANGLGYPQQAHLTNTGYIY